MGRVPVIVRRCPLRHVLRGANSTEEVRTMKKILALLVVGTSIALFAAGAFAAEGGCHHNFPISGPNPHGTLQTGPVSPSDPPTGG